MAKKFTSRADTADSQRLSASVLASTEGLVMVLVETEKLFPNPDQPREVYNQEELEGLAASIQTNGFLQPIIAHQNADGTYTMVAGHRRHKAAQLLGLRDVPVLVRETPTSDFLVIALEENQKRENLHPVEEIRALKRLESQFETHEQAAKRAEMKRVTFSNKVRLAALGDEILNLCLKVPSISYNQLDHLMTLPEHKRLETVRKWLSSPNGETKTHEPRTKKVAPFRIVNTEKGNTYSLEFKPKKKNATLVDFAQALRKALQDIENQIMDQEK